MNGTYTQRRRRQMAGGGITNIRQIGKPGGLVEPGISKYAWYDFIVDPVKDFVTEKALPFVIDKAPEFIGDFLGGKPKPETRSPMGDEMWAGQELFTPPTFPDYSKVTGVLPPGMSKTGVGNTVAKVLEDMTGVDWSQEDDYESGLGTFETKKDKGGFSLDRALATILPGGDPGYDLGKKILGGLGGLGEFAGEFLGDWGNAIMAPGTKDKANWIGPVTMGLGIGALDKATRKTDMMPQDTSGIDIPAIRAAALQGQGGAFLPPASATTAYAQGGRTGYATGDTVDQNMITAFSVYKNAGGKEDFKGWFSDIYLPEVAQQRTPYEEESAPLEEEWDIFGRPRQPVYAAQGGRIGAQEGGLMNLGGMEKDYRQEGGFVPIGGQERADDVPARLSKNEFVFTADAVRSAGGGDIDAGAEVMENLMNNLEQGGQVSEDSQGLEGARDMFATAQRLEGVM